MATKICLDTDVVIALLRNEPGANALIQNLSELQITLSSITVFELLQRETSIKTAEEFVDNAEILPFNRQDGKRASQIFKELRKAGKIIDYRDIFIAASCIERQIPLYTLNAKHFRNIKGIQLFAAGIKR